MPEPRRPILFCINNPRSLDERRMLLDAGCVSRDCLGLCSQCFETRLLVQDDDATEGETYEAILAEIRRRARTDGDQEP